MYCPLFFNNIVIISAENNNNYLASNDQVGDFLIRKNFFIRVKNSLILLEIAHIYLEFIISLILRFSRV